MELSSFQLMTMQQSPHIAVVTNLSPNHLDYHHTMEEYTQAKTNIFSHQCAEDRAVFNQDNDITRQLAKTAKCTPTMFSRKEKLEDGGVYLRDNAIWLTNEIGSREVLPLSMIRIPGVHNIENYMAAIAAVDGIVPDKCVRAVAQRFTRRGAPHRAGAGAGRRAVVQRLHRHQSHPDPGLSALLRAEAGADCRRL